MSLLLTDLEVAAMLRCSAGKVARLRREGRLPSMGGRPALTLERDVYRYIEEEKEKQKCKRKRAVKPRQPQGSNGTGADIGKSGGQTATLPPDALARKAILAGQRIVGWRRMRVASSK